MRILDSQLASDKMAKVSVQMSVSSSQGRCVLKPAYLENWDPPQ